MQVVATDQSTEIASGTILAHLFKVDAFERAPVLIWVASGGACTARGYFGGLACGTGLVPIDANKSASLVRYGTDQVYCGKYGKLCGESFIHALSCLIKG